jgi:Tol biopolymer transport system component
MDKKTLQVAILSATGGAALVAAILLLLPRGGSQPTPEAIALPAVSAPQQASPAKPSNDPAEPEVIIAEIDVSEFRYLPERVSIQAGADNPMLRMPNMLSSARRVSNVRQLTDKERDGHFLAPRWSPDGLLMLASRIGFDGIYVVDPQTGQHRRIADGNAFRARWTPDGLIEVPGDDGLVRTYDADGTLISTAPGGSNSGRVYAEQDTVYVRTPGGGSVPLTGGDDRYFNPVVSPDGSTVVFQGLLSGLYMAPADGSGEPVYIGTGNNPVWSPDSGGVYFDVTADDGHHLTEGDIYYVDRGQTERTNLTPGDNLISQAPSVSPDGSTLVFEAEGNIYVGEVR